MVQSTDNPQPATAANQIFRASRRGLYKEAAVGGWPRSEFVAFTLRQDAALTIDVLLLDPTPVPAKQSLSSWEQDAEPQLAPGRLPFNADHLREYRMETDMTKRLSGRSRPRRPID